MIADLKQPAKDWLADVLQNFGRQMASGEDPTLIVTISGVKMEIRLNEIPGHYKRDIQCQTPSGPRRVRARRNRE